MEAAARCNCGILKADGSLPEFQKFQPVGKEHHLRAGITNEIRASDGVDDVVFARPANPEK